MKIKHVLLEMPAQMTDSPKKKTSAREKWQELYSKYWGLWIRDDSGVSPNWYHVVEGPRTPYLDVRVYGRRYDDPYGPRRGRWSGSVAALGGMSPGRYRIRDIAPVEGGYLIKIRIPGKTVLDPEQTFFYDPKNPPDTIQVRIDDWPATVHSAMGLLKWRKAIGWDK